MRKIIGNIDSEDNILMLDAIGLELHKIFKDEIKEIEELADYISKIKYINKAEHINNNPFSNVKAEVIYEQANSLSQK